MNTHTQQIYNAVRCQQPVEARRIKRLTDLDISVVHSCLRELHADGKVKERSKNRKRVTQPFVWEVV